MLDLGNRFEIGDLLPVCQVYQPLVVLHLVRLLLILLGQILEVLLFQPQPFLKDLGS